MKEKKIQFNEPLSGRRFARSQYSFILGTLKARKTAFYQIKELLPYPELCEAADFIDKNFNEKFKELMFGNPLPKSFKELGVCEYSYASNTLIQEINWTLIAIRKYSYEVNLFVAYKELFEFNLVLGNYPEAERYLTKIESEICVSVWSLENRFLLLERTEGITDNKALLSKFNQENQSARYTKPLAHYLSIRGEKSLSVDRYNWDLRDDLDGLKGSKREQHIDYYLFKLSFLNNFDFSHFNEILSYDFHHSIADRYLNLVKVLTFLLTAANDLLNQSQEGQIAKSSLVSRLGYLLRKVNDPILYKLKLFASEKQFSAFNDLDSSREVNIIDKYTTGLYDEVQEDVGKLLLEKPLQFDLYVLYINSLVYQKKGFEPIGLAKSIQNSILSQMYKIVSVSVNPVEAGLELNRLANNISSCILSYGIVDFVNHETKGRSERKLFARLSYNAANPIISEIYPDSQSQLNYLQMLKSKFPLSITIDFLTSKISGTEDISSFQQRIPEAKFKTQIARVNQSKGQFAEASMIWSELILDNAGNMPILETAIRNQYICLENLKKFDQCLSLYVDSFLKNEYIVDKIDTDYTRERIRDSRFKVVPPSLELAIFYTISSSDETEIHTAFEKFNLSVGVCRPSELLDRMNEFDHSKMKFFLKHTCSPEILKHSIHINGSKDRLEERLKITQFLKDIDLDDRRFYEDEIKSITNILIIQKGLLELDESKIYVNEQGIFSNELREYETSYLSFKAFSKLAEKSRVWLLDKNRRLGTYADENDTGDIEYSSNPVYDVYKVIFDAIKDKFLNSKFGIVAYLSTRIRHGVLLGELRPIFEKHKLITQKEGESSVYRQNSFWENSLWDLSSIERARIQSCLSEFSYSVDGLIYDLIKKFLQVYHDKNNPDGWFNYDFNDEELFWFSIRALKTKDFNEFANEVFEILWERTDANLKLIRERIQIDVSKRLNELFDTLETDISNLLDHHHSHQFVKAIKDCSTETQAAVKRISSWFKRSGTSTSDFHIDSLIDIVMEYVNKTHPLQRINLVRRLKHSCVIKGEFYTHFADLFRIFFENILKHADEKIRLIDASITTDYSNGFLMVCIENAITKREGIEALKNVWGESTLNIAKLREEGKSGYHKAFKIIKSDLKCEENSLATTLDQTEELFSVVISIHLEEVQR